MFEREPVPQSFSDCVVLGGAGERQIITLPPTLLLDYLGWRQIDEARVPLPRLRTPGTTVTSAPVPFVAALWIGVAAFAVGAFWLALH